MTSARSTQSLHLGKPELLRAFKGKELTLRLNSRGKHVLYISQTEFIRGLDSGKVPKDADLEQPLTAEQQGELRSVAGCLQAVVVRAIAPRAFPQVALNSRSSLNNLKSLYFALGFVKSTAEHGLLLPDVAAESSDHFSFVQ